MQMIITVANGPDAGKKLMLRQGQAATVGRTEWADFSVPSDSSLAECHFQICCESQGCMLTDPDAHGVHLNGKPIQTLQLMNGHRLQAGETLFDFEIVGGTDSCCHSSGGESSSLQPVAQKEDALAPTEMPNLVAVKPDTASAYCLELDLGDAAKQVLDDLPNDSPYEFLDGLIANELHPDVLSVMAALLDVEDAVRWGVQCLRLLDRQFEEADEAAAKAIAEWLEEPTEETRRAAEAIATANEFNGPFSWIAIAAFWGSGSIAPAGQQAVAAPWYLTARGVVAGLILAATAIPETAHASYSQFIEIGHEQLAERVA